MPSNPLFRKLQFSHSTSKLVNINLWKTGNLFALADLASLGPWCTLQSRAGDAWEAGPWWARCWATVLQCGLLTTDPAENGHWSTTSPVSRYSIFSADQLPFSPQCLKWKTIQKKKENLWTNQVLMKLLINNWSFSCDVIAAMLEDDNKRFLISFYC